MVIDKIKKRIEYDNKNSNSEKEEHRSDIPVGKWVKCSKCKEILYKEDLHKNYSICPNCGNHFRLSSRRRVEQIIDKGTFKEFDLKIDTDNPLQKPVCPVAYPRELIHPQRFAKFRAVAEHVPPGKPVPP